MAEDQQRQLPHIYLPAHGEREDFTSPQGGGGSGTIPQRNREQHARRLDQMLTEAVEAAQERIANRDPDISGGTPGFYLEFELPQSQQSVLDKLENKQGREHIELVAARPSAEDPDRIKATVFVPESRREHYLRKVRAYGEEDNVRYEKDDAGNFVLDEAGNRMVKSRRPKNQALVASLETARIAEAESLYTDDLQLFPAAGQEVWWEVWLRHDGRPILEHAAQQLEVATKEHSVTFPEREVVLLRAAPETIGLIIANTDAIAELRMARDTPSFFMEMDGAGQLEWSQELADRIVAPGGDAPAVCLLDSGTTRRHPLITPALAEEDQQAWDADWNVEDVGVQWLGHGTQMSGVALYGDLTEPLVEHGPVELRHRLESVKILPDHGANDPDLYGYITATAMGRIEVQAPERPRAYCLAVTSEGDHWRGRPSSWSAKVDDLAYGDGEDQRLIMISAGNIRTFYPAVEYLDNNDTAVIESPAQAWNALTVGGVTEKVTITHPDFQGWEAMATAGDLSPCSRTSVNWNHDWPIKPDVVFEGGNYGVDPQTGAGDHVDDLALLTTFNRPAERAFTVTGDTSAATAQAARMAAQILADQPDLWPETVRGLIVHSAEWTPAMLAHLPQNPNKTHQRLIMRRYGYGVPSLEKAVRSLTSDVTMVIESDLQPFLLEGSRTRSRDMMLHDLPWPEEALNALGETLVEMRATLSYFVEPNPGERGWTKRHSYSGHGLRFSVKRPEESLDRFRRRVNKAARDEDERVAGAGNDDGWVLGPRLRDRGSVHSDVWRGTATDLANRHAIGVYPVGGWWREKPKLERADRRVRYSLIVSLRANVEVDLYAEIANAIGVEVEIEA
ncbi:S8 family peptidase [Yunchengibacter salinarum]|uniref:S8 family peptidase n=1 Tax=Yunchengibacter salinarum TaxID=3133399 RepID=UPI0035B63287